MKLLVSGVVIEVIDQARWTVHWGGLNNPHGGLEGQLTKCRQRGRLSARHTQVLELAAPKGDWDRIAAIVHEADALKRAGPAQSPLHQPLGRNHSQTNLKRRGAAPAGAA